MEVGLLESNGASSGHSSSPIVLLTPYLKGFSQENGGKTKREASCCFHKLHKPLNTGLSEIVTQVGRV